MIQVVLVLLPLLGAEPPAPAAEETTPVVTPDGGAVPTVIPEAKDKLAPVLAPERTPDGGVAADGGTSPVVTNPTLSVYKVDLPVETTVTAGSVALYVIVDYLIKPTLEGDVSCRRPVGNGRCNPADLTAFDRYAVGRSSPGWATFSDIALVGSVLAPILYLGLESLVLPTQQPWGDFGRDLLIVAEAMSLTGAFNTVLKFAFRRPRPIRYTDLDQPLAPFDAELSFPSGHTSMVAAATTALTATVVLRHPHSPMRFVVMGAGVLLTALTGFARVESGNHFPTDVLVGALMGGFAGFFIPYTHRKQLPVVPTGSVDPVTGATTLGVAGHL